jgi:hypothetical protein
MQTDPCKALRKYFAIILKTDGEMVLLKRQWHELDRAKEIGR